MKFQPGLEQTEIIIKGASPEPSLSEILSRTLPPAFYEQPTLDVARQMLGKTLVVRPGGVEESETTAAIIVETEGYAGPDDPASHSFTGRTRRNDIMWGPPGVAYVYFTYGNHWMVNVVTMPEGYASAVLVRAVQPLLGLEAMRERRGLHLLKGNPGDLQLTNGPGKLCRAMGITGRLNGQSFMGPRLYLAETPPDWQLPAFETVETTRVGISRGLEFPWRFYVRGNRFVSRL